MVVKAIPSKVLEILRLCRLVAEYILLLSYWAVPPGERIEVQMTSSSVPCLLLSYHNGTSVGAVIREPLFGWFPFRKRNFEFSPPFQRGAPKIGPCRSLELSTALDSLSIISYIFQQVLVSSFLIQQSTPYDSSLLLCLYRRQQSQEIHREHSY